MSVKIKSAREIELMTESGRILAMVLEELGRELREGISTADLDHLGKEIICSYGGSPSFLGYDGYPSSICVSVNDEIVHGIPDRHKILKNGDLVSLDAGVVYKGYHSDAARTYILGDTSDDIKKLVQVTEQSFFEGIKYAKEGYHLYDISRAIDEYAGSFGYGVVRELCGHGIGTKLHEDPQIPNVSMPRRGMKLKAGMTLAVEPMVNLGTAAVKWQSDGWTVVTKDHKPSAHYENTILITEEEPQILTLLKDYGKGESA